MSALSSQSDSPSWYIIFADRTWTRKKIWFSVKTDNRRALFSSFSLIVEGATQKVSQLTMPMRSIYNKTRVLLNKNLLLNTEKAKTIKYIYNYIFNVLKNAFSLSLH